MNNATANEKKLFFLLFQLSLLTYSIDQSKLQYFTNIKHFYLIKLFIVYLKNQLLGDKNV